MWSLRRGIAAAAAGGLRKIPPRVVTQPPPFSCWSRFSESNSTSNPCQNNFNLIKDPELSELVKLYDRECRTCRHTSAGSNKFHTKGKLDNLTKANKPIKSDSPTKANKPIKLASPTEANKPIKLASPTEANIPIKLDSSTKAYILMPYSINKTKSLGSKLAQKKTKKDNPAFISLDKKVSRQRKVNGTHSYTTNKRNVRFSELASKHKTIGSKNSFESSEEALKSIKARKKISEETSKAFKARKKISEETLKSFKARKKISEETSKAFKARKKISEETLKEFKARKKISEETLKSFKARKNISEETLKSIKARKKISEEALKSIKARKKISEETLKSSKARKKISKPYTDKEINGNHEETVDSGNFSHRQSKARDRHESNPITSVFNYQFEPIDLVKHRMDFLTSHSQKPYPTKSVWPKIWPKPLERRQRNVKSEDPSLKERKRRLCKATSSHTQSRPIKYYKYHTFAVKDFHISDEIRESRPKRGVAIQTVTLPEGCELSNLCRPPTQPDEPSLMGMKKRLDREVLRRYYQRMRQRQKSSVSDSERSECKGSSSRYKMRRQLEQCEAALTLCGQLVEARLRLARIRARNEGCSCVPEPKQC